MLNKDPEKRVNLQQIREHDWITRSGEEPLISTNDNLEMVVLEVTDEELDCAICSITSVL